MIVPTYNVAGYIRDFFRSILSQSYKNLEVIIVADASTDNSVEIAEYFAARDHRIRIIKNTTNLGVACTLRRGYSAATGEFCATISPDDTVDMFYFENLIKRYQETKSDVIGARMVATEDNWMFSDGRDFTVYSFGAKLSSIFYFYPALVTRKLIVENNIWDSTIVERHWEDILIRCKYAYYANHVSIANSAIRYYTIRNTSLSHAPAKQQIEYKKIAERRSKEFLNSVGIHDVTISIVNGFKIVGGVDIKSWYIENKHPKKPKKTITAWINRIKH